MHVLSRVLDSAVICSRRNVCEWKDAAIGNNTQKIVVHYAKLYNKSSIILLDNLAYPH